MKINGNILSFSTSSLVHTKLIKKIGFGTFKIKTVEGEVEELPASDQILKNYSS
jgi:hypothetical protein